MSEADEPTKTTLAQASADAMAVDTMGGRVHVRWDETAQATPHGQIVFFAEFLATAGVSTAGCRYSSPNASSPRDVLGTLMLGILAGSKRYAHIAGVRGDTMAAKALGLKRWRCPSRRCQGFQGAVVATRVSSTSPSKRHMCCASPLTPRCSARALRKGGFSVLSPVPEP